MLRPTSGDPWGVEQHHWNTGAKENKQLNPGLCIDLDIYFRLFITKNAENSACQEDQVTAIFDFVTTGLVVLFCLTSRTFRSAP